MASLRFLSIFLSALVLLVSVQALVRRDYCSCKDRCYARVDRSCNFVVRAGAPAPEFAMREVSIRRRADKPGCDSRTCLARCGTPISCGKNTPKKPKKPKKPTPPKNIPTKPHCRDLNMHAYLRMSDEKLFAFQNPSNKIGGKCYVQKSRRPSACNYYVKAERSTSSGYKGWPRTRSGDRGTGCVKDRGGGFCYFKSTTYDLTTVERNSMCSGNVKANAAAQLRHAIRNGKCGCHW